MFFGGFFRQANEIDCQSDITPCDYLGVFAFLSNLVFATWTRFSKAYCIQNTRLTEVPEYMLILGRNYEGDD